MLCDLSCDTQRAKGDVGDDVTTRNWTGAWSPISWLWLSCVVMWMAANGHGTPWGRMGVRSAGSENIAGSLFVLRSSLAFCMCSQAQLKDMPELCVADICSILQASCNQPCMSTHYLESGKKELSLA